MRQPLEWPTSMYSIKRRMWPFSLKKRAIGRMLSSLSPRLTTMLTLIGLKPTLAAASIPSSTLSTAKSTSFMDLNILLSSESRLTVIRFNPASLSARACRASKAPLVVNVRSRSGMVESMEINWGKSRRTNGSPPVKRILRTPCETKIRARRSISSKVRI